jgi:hypothetical protein
MCFAFPSIRTLYLVHTSISPVGISALSTLKQLEFLQLDNVTIDRSQVSALSQALASLPNLRFLELMTDMGPPVREHEDEGASSNLPSQTCTGQSSIPVSMADQVTGLTHLVIKTACLSTTGEDNQMYIT